MAKPSGRARVRLAVDNPWLLGALMVVACARVAPQPTPSHVAPMPGLVDSLKPDDPSLPLPKVYFEK